MSSNSRYCYDLAYLSENEDRASRLQRKADKLADRFDWDEEGDFYYKPKGMHWRTIERLSAEYQQVSNAADSAFVRRLMALAGNLDMDELADLV